MSDANKVQIGGNHYQTVPGEQHWDRQWRLFGRGYFVGNITAYVERYHEKNGLEDLKKAKHYVEKLIELENAAILAGTCTMRNTYAPIGEGGATKPIEESEPLESYGPRWNGGTAYSVKIVKHGKLEELHFQGKVYLRHTDEGDEIQQQEQARSMRERTG